MARRRIKGSGSPRVASTTRISLGSASARATAGAIRRSPINTVTRKSRLQTPDHRGMRMPGRQAPDTLGPNY